jgi:propanol-preferring alcohol dehydrogenase
METICKAGEASGYTRPGGYAEYMVADAAFVARLPKNADLYQLAPILCAGVTTYRGLKRTNARPGQWVAVVGIGGLGHLAVQYARAMGYRVAAVDVADGKLRLARKLGAELTVNGKEKNAPQLLQDRIGGAHGAIVTAVAPQAFEQAIAMLRPAGTVVFSGLPGGDKDMIRTSISTITNGELSVRGSNVGTRLDLAEAVAFAANGLVAARIRKAPLERINAIFDEMRAGKVLGRMVLNLA